MSRKQLITLTPDLTLIFSVIVAYLLDRTMPVSEIIPFPLTLAGLVIIVAAFYLAISVLTKLKQNRTTTDAAAMPTTLITSGLYARSRNPFYLLSLCTTVGVAVALGSLAAFIAPVIYFAVLQFFIIPVEEKNLDKAFGPVYKKYQQVVRRWL